MKLRPNRNRLPASRRVLKEADDCVRHIAANLLGAFDFDLAVSERLAPKGVKSEWFAMALRESARHLCKELRDTERRAAPKKGEGT